MPFNWDATDVADDGAGRVTLLPPGWYEFRVGEATEKQSSNGNPMVALKCIVTEPMQFTGKWVWHNVTFMPAKSKGAYMAMHFLKCIGEPHEGVLKVNATKWIGKRFRGKVKHGEYKGQPKNEIKEVSPADEVQTDDQIPF